METGFPHIPAANRPLGRGGLPRGANPGFMCRFHDYQQMCRESPPRDGALLGTLGDHQRGQDALGGRQAPRRPRRRHCFGKPSLRDRPASGLASQSLLLPLKNPLTSQHPSGGRLPGPGAAEHNTLHGLGAAADGAQGLLRLVLSSP